MDTPTITITLQDTPEGKTVEVDAPPDLLLALQMLSRAQVAVVQQLTEQAIKNQKAKEPPSGILVPAHFARGN